MHLRFLLLFFFSVTGAISSLAQDRAEKYAGMITGADLHENLSILASDALEGRATGTRGQKMAAAFIRHHFQQLGLTGPVDGSYYQPFDLYKTVPGDVYVKVGGITFKNFAEIAHYGNDDSGGDVTIPVVFAGKGRAEDFTQIEVAGKGVLILVGEEEDYRGPISMARSKNAAAVFVLNTRTDADFSVYAAQFKKFLSEGRLSLKKPQTENRSAGVFFVSPVVAEKIFNTSLARLTEAVSPGAKKNSVKKLGEGQVTYRTTVDVETVETENVLGFLEGTDKKEEVIVITSHYDHIGKESEGEGDLINNGADDDGSGTVAVLQLAKAFAEAKEDGNGPRRSILFMTVAGEENGLLGSEYYTQYPVYPLDNTVVNLNIDMIGRRDEEHKESPPYVYVIGSDKLSTELHELNESANEEYTKLIFDYTYNDEDHPARLYYRSDHWNFAQKNIPIIFYFDGIHEDYHQPSDEVDKIEFDLLTQRSKCIFHTAWEIANREDRILPDTK